MRPGETWHDTFTVPGPTTYILDFSDWHNHPNVEVRLIIDGQVRLDAHGTSANLAGWQREIGPRVRQTDDREIAISKSMLPAAANAMLDAPYAQPGYAPALWQCLFQMSDTSSTAARTTPAV